MRGICTALNLSDSEQIEAMRRRLRAMERDGQIAKNRRGGYGTLEKLNLIKKRQSYWAFRGLWFCFATKR